MARVRDAVHSVAPERVIGEMLREVKCRPHEADGIVCRFLRTRRPCPVEVFDALLLRSTRTRLDRHLLRLLLPFPAGVFAFVQFAYGAAVSRRDRRLAKTDVLPFQPFPARDVLRAMEGAPYELKLAVPAYAESTLRTIRGTFGR
ncbi:unnamed protein product, partial [Closterium sp. NIES-53]